MGEVFAGRYELLDPIATGGMGTVWCVLDQQDGQVKAAKILRQSDAASLLRFVREQSMRIDHDHVVTPQSWAGMDDRVLFTMPLVRGGSVAGLIKEHGVLPVRWAALLVDQTLQALEAVHAAGIVHRDVKPANLLLEPTGHRMPHLRLTDFGIAAPLDEPRMTRASVVIGSPGYMSPEQWRGGDPDFRSDIYSAGRVGIEMLTGERPSAENHGVDVTSLATGEANHDALLRLFGEAADEDATRRPASASEFRQRLAALGSTTLPPAPDESIFIRDHFAQRAPVPTTPDGATVAGTVGGPGGTAALTASSTLVSSAPGHRPMTRVDHGAPTMHQPVPPGADTSHSRVPAVLLLLVGLLCLVGAGFLLA
ncbi:serine/threonine-protein kinase [Nocardioides sp. AE5]|uniref:serine/threonine-protein kinase n=1 Tax=Nocardioides sp. AE5 TaxID=2962573 RepID=UPI0028826ABC|nr:serine/threonine-protein kinase [Nocardioides sp. AE5]MDT0201030.1 serine/threonine-protein kinase [Nocardioides sp. AE5]